MRAMDPYAVLGLEPDASRRDVKAAYHRLAKDWHPDRRHDREAERKMAEINGAYELLRPEAWPARRQSSPGAPRAPFQPRTGRGAWLPPMIRRALGRELIGVLEPDEQVWLVTPTTTWASPQALLAA